MFTVIRCCMKKINTLLLQIRFEAGLLLQTTLLIDVQFHMQSHSNRLVYYCAKVMQANFDECLPFRGLLSKIDYISFVMKFRRISLKFQKNFVTTKCNFDLRKFRAKVYLVFDVYKNSSEISNSPHIKVSVSYVVRIRTKK